MNFEKVMQKQRFFLKFFYFSVFLTLMLLLCVSLVSAQYSYQYSPFSYYGEASQYYFPSITPEVCESGKWQDFIVEIPPGACSPAVVRSDLLEEQDVPVFCRLVGLKVNPLIEVPYIKSINIVGKPQKEVATILFHPYRAALKTPTTFSELLGSPLGNEFGYVVVVLKSMPEAEMPKEVEVNLSTRILYDLTASFGIGDNKLVLPVLNEEQWSNRYTDYNFWYGKGYARAKSVGENSARIEIYFSSEQPVASFDLVKGDPAREISPVVFLPGMYCSGGLRVRLDDIRYPETKAKLIVNGNKIEVVEGMKILDDRCSVKSIEASAFGVGGRVVIACPEGEYPLERATARAWLEVKGNGIDKKEWYSVGSSFIKLEDGKQARYYIAATGKAVVQDVLAEFVVIGKDLKATDINAINAKIKNFIRKKDFKSIEEFRQGIEKEIRNAKLIIKSGKVDGINVNVLEVEGLVQASYSALVEKYYKNAIEGYEEVARNWPSAQKPSGETIGETALLEAAQKAAELNKGAESARLFEEFLKNYPESSNADIVKGKLSLLYMTGDITKAEKDIISAGKGYHIILEDIDEPTKEELSVEVSVNDVFGKYALKDSIDGWIVDEIKPDSVIFRNMTSDFKRTVGRGKEESLGKLKVKVLRINLERYAAVSVLPYSKEGETFANFSVHIGIEKRAIRLSTEQTQKLITDLDKTITRWEDVKDKLGKVVESWKKVCLAGSATIWVGNFLSNLAGGKALARQFVMREADIEGYKGWSNWCADKKNQESVEAKSLSDCLYKSREKIDTDVDRTETIIDGWNDKIAELQKRPGVTERTGLLKLRSSVNREKLLEEVQKSVLSTYRNSEQIAVMVEGKEKTVSTKEINKVLDGIASLSEKGYVSLEDARKLSFNLEMRKACKDKTGVCSGVEKQLYDIFSSYSGSLDSLEKTNKATELLQTVLKEGASIPLAPLFTKKEPFGAPVVKAGDYFKENALSPVNIDPKQEIAIRQISLTEKETEAIGTYIFVVTETAGRYLVTTETKIFKAEKERLVEANPKEKSLIRKFVGEIIPEKACNYRYLDPQIRFWESGPFRGLPAVMPLGPAGDGSRGWFAATKAYGDSLRSGLTQMEAYTEAGEPTHFYICNVGPNGKVDFGDRPSGEDRCCQYFALTETYTGKTTLPGMDAKQTEALVSKARTCIRDAAAQYGKAKEGQTISTACGSFVVGKPKAIAPSVECEDFMSPLWCRLLYNLCDPVICPPSRCDLGGRFRTENVVQTGIIGSLVLCWPNFGEVAMPICLTGVHAGLDNLITILKSVRGCLQESLDTGKNVGICDELKSIYLCEFFWRELTPFLRAGLPMLIEKAVYGRRGGGEYLTFAEAWETSISQVQYFTQYYGVNAMRAFQVRSTAEAGSVICRAFVGLRYPDSASLFDELAKPESPVQINAWFDEVSFSTATVPPISHYKVYWHIFAGRDEPAYWTVYLKNPPYVSYPQLPETYMIQTGYLPAGEFSDETRDFTAPTGYKELCVRVNLKEYCGFKKVTTGFAVEELTDLYVANQTIPTLAVMTEEECTSGESAIFTGDIIPSSLIPLITQPGMGGIEEALQPAIWRRGIIRICSQENPGKGVDEGRWDRVGFCDPDKKIGCWLDRESVEGAIKDLALESWVLNESQQISTQILEDLPNYISEDKSAELYREIEKAKPILLRNIGGIDLTKSDKEIESAIQAAINETVANLTKMIEWSVSPRYKAEAQMQLALIYNNIALHLKPKVIKVYSPEIAKPEKPTECYSKKYSSLIENVLKQKKITGWNGYEAQYLIEALVSFESGGDPTKESPAGAVGLMQILPSTAEKIEKGANLRDPETNIKIGTTYFNNNFEEYKDVKLALAVYFGGPKAVDTTKWGEIKDVYGTTVAGYVDNVLVAYELCKTHPEKVVEEAKLTIGAISYVSDENESIDSVIDKTYLRLAPTYAKRSEDRERLIIANNGKQSFLAGEQIIIPLKDFELEVLKDADLPFNCDECRKEKTGISPFCTQKKCDRISLKIVEKDGAFEAMPERCYFSGTVVAGWCKSCSEATECADFHNDEERCGDSKCIGLSEIKGNCNYLEGRCVPVVPRKEYDEILLEVRRELEKVESIERNERIVEKYETILTSFAGLPEAENAAKEMLKYSKLSTGGEKVLYQILAKYSTADYERKDPSVYGLAIQAKEMVTALDVLEELRKNLHDCLGKESEEYCRCSEIDINKIEELYQLENFKIVLVPVGGKITAQLIKGDENMKIAYLPSASSLRYFTESIDATQYLAFGTENYLNQISLGVDMITLGKPGQASAVSGFYSAKFERPERTILLASSSISKFKKKLYFMAQANVLDPDYRAVKEC